MSLRIIALLLILYAGYYLIIPFLASPDCDSWINKKRVIQKVDKGNTSVLNLSLEHIREVSYDAENHIKQCAGQLTSDVQTLTAKSSEEKEIMYTLQIDSEHKKSTRVNVQR